MKTLSILAVIAATATPALAEFNPHALIGSTAVTMTDEGNDFGSKQPLDNNPR